MILNGHLRKTMFGNIQRNDRKEFQGIQAGVNPTTSTTHVRCFNYPAARITGELLQLIVNMYTVRDHC